MSVKKNGLTFFDRLILWFNYAMVLALLIGYLAPYADPRKFWIIAFFGLAYPPLLLANVLLIVYWLIRKSKWVFLSLAGILIGWNTLNNNIGFRLPSNSPSVKDSAMLRVMNYNVHDFKNYDRKKDSSTRHEILEIVDHEQPDVIGMEEFFNRKKGQYAMVDSFKKVLKTNYVHYVPFVPNYGYRFFETYGIALFSKYPIVDQGVVRITVFQSLNQAIYADLLKNNQRIRVYVVHLRSIKLDPEDYKYLVNIPKEGKTDMKNSWRIVNKLKTAFALRSEQVAILKSHMAVCPYPYVVIGDFNDTPSSYALNRMSKGLKNAFREKGSGLGRTYNGDFPNYQIDYILTSKHFDVLTYGVIRKKLSDHYPVYSDLKLK